MALSVTRVLRPGKRRRRERRTGLGREGSHHGIEAFIELKYVMMGGLKG